jgi:hypothetical protein
MRGIRNGDGIRFGKPPVAAGRHGLDELRAPGVVAERLAELRDDPRQGVVGDCGPRPDAVENLLLGHHVRVRLDEQDEDVKRLGLELDWPTGALGTKGGEIDAELPEGVSAAGLCHFNLPN